MPLPPLRTPIGPTDFVEPADGLASIAERIGERSWALIPDFLDPSVVMGLREEALTRRESGRFRPAAVGRSSGVRIIPQLRSDQLSWIEPDDRVTAVNAYLLAMEGLRQAMNRHLYLGLLTLESQFAIYPPGSRYGRHVDRHRDNDERILSCVCYLNRDWQAADGGQLRLYLDGEDGTEESFDVFPETGLLVAFLSDRIPHEVLPAKRERLSIASWFRGRPR